MAGEPSNTQPLLPLLTLQESHYLHLGLITLTALALLTMPATLSRAFVRRTLTSQPRSKPTSSPK